ncbi:MAG TPA: penicillin-binding protein 2 [Acidimicrobiales bacterium]|nr:penicillin-binding protein 2 [Acidimicrobiales bacterium]
MTAPVRAGDNARLRLSVLAMVVVSLFAALYARLWYLQVASNAQAQVKVTNNQVRFVHEEAPRGRILDRNGKVIVDNRVSEAITVNRAKFNNDVEHVTRLAALLGIPPGILVKRMSDPRFSPYKPVPVATDVPKDMVVYLAEHQDDFPGVEALELTERAYPQGNVAAHLLGYVGEINDRELKDRKGKGYQLGDNIGKSGVELSYESDLHGVAGLTKFEVDAQGRVLQTLDARPAQQGADVQLTLDLDIQKLVEDSLAQGLDATRHSYDKENKKDFLAPAGAAVVLDPRDGSVVAMASNPTYNPADFVNGIKPELFNAMQDPNSHFPLNNRVINGLYAPGSTFKLATALAALDSGLITPGTPFTDTGSLQVGNRLFKNAGSRAYGTISLPTAITVSSDAFFYNLGAQFWYTRSQHGDAIQATAKTLGFGERTGIPLDSEAKGRIPDPESRKKLHDANPKAFPEGRWFAGDNVNLAIGQGEMVVTPLQLAQSYATFANGGTVYQPRVAERILQQDGKVIRDVTPAPERKIDLAPTVRNAILTGLKGVVASDKGTAHGSFIGFPLSSFPVAGKTGTAQVFGKQDTALFVAFAPADNPQYVVAVVIEEGGFGGSSAAPVVRRIMEGLAGKTPGPIAVQQGVD